MDAGDFDTACQSMDSKILDSFPNPCKFIEQDYVMDSGIKYDYYRRFKQ
jgi:hypothetical protein